MRVRKLSHGFGAFLAALWAGHDAGASSLQDVTASGAASQAAPVGPTAGAQPTSAPSPRKRPAPLPPPSGEQLQAFDALHVEAERYESEARDYRKSIARIVQHHFEERRQRLLAALDAEIQVEKRTLRDTRDEAIRKLEAFVQKYSGQNAGDEATPNAMFRLAALYEERSRTDSDQAEELATGLAPAIALYKRIVREFPKYEERAGVYYYLGHALNDSGRLEEAQQVWRSLVCNNAFSYPVPALPEDPTRDAIVPLPQDHTADYWIGWENNHPTPIGKARVKAALAQGKGKPTELADEVAFKNPFPESCQPIAQTTDEGAEPRYLAEIWWQIGDYHFNEIGQEGGPFNFGRAEAAYRHSMAYKKPPVYGVAMYKLAWTYFKQQRYRASTQQFIELLRYTDEQEKLTGDPGTDFRSEAYAYIAGSLTYLDFDGPEPEEPFIPRQDVLDVELDPRIAESKMRVAIARVQDPQLIPQGEPWSVEVYKGLAQEFRELNQYRNTIEISELILKKWPMHRDAPVVQSQVADIWDLLTQQSREGTAEHKENSSKALAARTALAAFVGTTPWVEANKNDPEAIQTAERLVRGGLRRAAADHTNVGNSVAQEGLRSVDVAARNALFERALGEYQLAAQGWEGYLRQDESAADAYETRYWLADANHMVVVLKVALGQVPTAGEFDAARVTALDVRDSNEDDKFLQPAAYLVVDTAHQRLLSDYRQFAASQGAAGIEERKSVKTEGEGNAKQVIKEEVPSAIRDAIEAREEYIARVPPPLDSTRNIDRYAFDIADYYFVYGQFDQARQRLAPIYAEQCGKTEYGYRAWERLTTMSNLENNVEESRRLAEAALARSCAVSEEQKVAEGAIARPTLSRGYYVDAARAFEKAEKMPDGPARAQAWRDAAALYRVALEKAPARDEAPEAAMNGAYCYKQVGDYDQAIAMYNLFIQEYGNADNLRRLEKGDAGAAPPVDANPTAYAERVKYLKQAYDALSAAYVLFFNYRAAAETYDVIARNERFEESARRDAARNAIVLYSNVGDRDRMEAARRSFMGLKPPADKRAEIDFLAASADLKAWDERGADEGENRASRVRAMKAMEDYYTLNRAKSEANPFAVQAAFQVAKMRMAARDPRAKEWCRNTIAAFDRFRLTATGERGALGSLQADMAAECEFIAIDEKIRTAFDYDSGHHRYEGVIDKVKRTFDADLKKANDVYFKDLQRIIASYESPAWSVAARARQGSLYDSVRTGLYNARPPALKLYTEREERLLKMAEDSDRDDLVEQADALRQSRRETWRAARDTALSDADQAMVKFYAEAVVWSRAWKLSHPAVTQAIQRLAFFTDILGDERIRELTQGITDPGSQTPFEYAPGLFLRTRPGQLPAVGSQVLPFPLPVAVQ